PSRHGTRRMDYLLKTKARSSNYTSLTTARQDPGYSGIATNIMTTIEAVGELRKEFGRRGWNEKMTGPIVLELLVHIALAALGILIFIAFHNLAARVAGTLIATFGCMGVGTNTHTSSHYGTSEKRWVNEALTYFGYPFFLGLSATFWWYKHVVQHHPAPNVIG